MDQSDLDRDPIFSVGPRFVCVHFGSDQTEKSESPDKTR